MEKLNRLERLAQELERAVGGEISAEVMGDWQGLTSGSSPGRKSKWVLEMMERMSARLDEETQIEVLRGCSCSYRKDVVADYRLLFEQTHSIDLLLETMRENTRTMIDRKLDASLQEQVKYHPFYHSPIRDGLIVRFYAFPYHIAEYLREMDPVKRRKHACHCGWISASKENVPLTYCACGTGFYKQLWEGILGQEIEVRVVQSVMHGDERCQFDVVLPDWAVQH
jgi:hypothetical protein